MKLSIVIPVFNSYNFLSRTLNSLVESDIYDVISEIIIIDDSNKNEKENISIPDCLDIYTTILINDKNMGVTFSRNKGYIYASGDYILFLDSDDCISNNGWPIIIDKIKKTNPDLILLRCADMNSNLIGDFENESLSQGLNILFDTYNKGERLLMVKKYNCLGMPFLGSLRGCELTGLVRFLMRLNPKILNLQNIGRVYYSDNIHSISKIDNLNKRRLIISKGHYILGVSLIKNRKNYSYAIYFLMKCFYQFVRGHFSGIKF
jgi:glycosyltransferase involved in cell wall biosynthesis